MNRAARRDAEKAIRRGGKTTRSFDRDRGNIRLGAMPWKIEGTWQPLEQALKRMELDGSVDTAMGRPVFKEESQGGWYEIAPAIDGLVMFHQIASERYGWNLDVSPMEKLAAKFRYGTPVFERDMSAFRECAERCKRLTTQITLDQANDILASVRIKLRLNGEHE